MLARCVLLCSRKPARCLDPILGALTSPQLRTLSAELNPELERQEGRQTNKVAVASLAPLQDLEAMASWLCRLPVDR